MCCLLPMVQQVLKVLMGLKSENFNLSRFHQTGHIWEQICTILTSKLQIVLREFLKST